jgi:hypothetical protein
MQLFNPGPAMFVRHHSLDFAFILGTFVLCVWTALFSSFGPVSAETAMRQAFEDFAFPGQEGAVSAFDGQTSVAVDWNNKPDALFAAGVYPAVVTLKGAVPDRYLTDEELRDPATLQKLADSGHLRNVTVTFAVNAHRVGLTWQIEGVPLPAELLRQRVTALLTKSNGGRVKFVKDAGPYGRDGVTPALREGNGSAAFVFALLDFSAALMLLLLEGATLGYRRPTKTKLLLLGCALLMGGCTWQVSEGFLALMALRFS